MPRLPREIYSLATWQDRDRHLLTHLPHWLHCPAPDCSWRGNRVKSFENHWRRHDLFKHYTPNGASPEREQFELFNPQEFVDRIKAGTITVRDAADRALELVRAKADQLQKPSLSANPWGYKLKAGPSHKGSLLETEPDMSEHVQDDVTMRPPVIDGSEYSTGAT